MTLVETQDAQLIHKIIAAEIANAEASGAIVKGSVSAPLPGMLEVCMKAGDFCFTDDKEPRIAGWYHPLSKTEVAAMHLWGPSDGWKALLSAVADLLLAKGFVTARWQDGNPLSTAAVPMTGGAKSASGESTVNIAQAKIALTAAALDPKAK